MVIVATNCLVGEVEGLGDLTLPTKNEATGYYFAVVTFPMLSHHSFKIPASGGWEQFANKACIAEHLILLFHIAKRTLLSVIHKVDEPALESTPPFHSLLGSQLYSQGRWTATSGLLPWVFLSIFILLQQKKIQTLNLREDLWHTFLDLILQIIGPGEQDMSFANSS